MTRPRYRLLPHTADVRIAIWGSDERELLENTALAVSRVVMGRALALRRATSVRVADWPATVEARLVAVANETIFELLHRGRVPTGFRYRSGVPRLELAELPGPLHPELEVKAATYHGLRVRRAVDRSTVVMTLDL